MSKLKVLSVSCMLALAALPGPVFAQYIYIDAKEFGGDVRTTGRRVSWLEDISKAGKCRKGSRVP